MSKQEDQDSEQLLRQISTHLWSIRVMLTILTVITVVSVLFTLHIL